MKIRQLHTCSILMFFLLIAIDIKASQLIDSLQLQLLGTSEKKERIDLYVSIGNAYLKISRDSVEKYFNLALEDAQKTSSHKDDIEVMVKLIAYNYRFSNDYTKAITYCKKALQLAEKNDAKKNTADLLNRLGLIYWKKGDYKQEVKYKFEAYYLAEEINDPYLQAITSLNLGTLHMEGFAYQEAEEYYEQALCLVEGKREETMGIILNNLGLLYLRMDKYDKALNNFKESLSIFEELKNDYWKSLIYTNIGYSYSLKAQYKKAIETYEKALIYNQTIGDKGRKAAIFLELARTFEAAERHEKAIEQSIKTLTLLDSLDTKYYYNDLYQILGRCYEHQGNFKNASLYFKKSVVSEEGKLEEDKQKELTKMKVVYAGIQKNKQISQLEIQNKNTIVKRQRTIFTLKVSIILSLLILSLFGLQYYRMKFKALEKYDTIRTRLTNDLHHNIGSSLNQIKILASNVKQNQQGDFKKNNTEVSRIKTISNDLISNMYDLIWSIDKDKAKLDDLLNHMRDHTSNIFSPLDLPYRMKINIDEKDKMKIIETELKNNIYSLYKEAINIVKYTRPEDIQIFVDIINNKINLRIQNDKNKLRINKVSHNNGLKSMTDRAKIIGGILNIEDKEDLFIVNFQVELSCE